MSKVFERRLYVCYTPRVYITFITAVVLRFDAMNYSVAESSGLLQICVVTSIIIPSQSLSLSVVILAGQLRIVVNYHMLK